jgi:hypothetical protein
MDGMSKGPYISMWMMSKLEADFVELLLKESLFCFAKKQASQGIEEFEILTQGKFLFSSINLSFEG